MPHPSSHGHLDLPGLRARQAGPQALPAHAAARRRRRLEPIGPQKLRALREAILNGSYPLDDAVIGGLARMFLGPTAPPRRRRP